MSWNKATNKDASLALLLPTLLNLEKLDLNIDSEIDCVTRVMEGVARKEAPFDTRPAFENLTDVMQAMAELNYRMKPQHLAVPLQLPAIKAIFGDRINSEDNENEEWSLRDLTTASPTVRHLELRESKLIMAELMV